MDIKCVIYTQSAWCLKLHVFWFVGNEMYKLVSLIHNVPRDSFHRRYISIASLSGGIGIRCVYRVSKAYLYSHCRLPTLNVNNDSTYRNISKRHNLLMHIFSSKLDSLSDCNVHVCDVAFIQAMDLGHFIETMDLGHFIQALDLGSLLYCCEQFHLHTSVKVMLGRRLVSIRRSRRNHLNDEEEIGYQHP